MNITKNILLFLFSLVSTINLAQSTSEIDCGDGFETIEVELESQKSVSYKVIYSQKLYTEDSFEFSEGVIVISDLNDKNSINDIAKIIATIGAKNKLSKITAFKTCKAVDLYFQKFKLTPKDANYLENNMLPKIEIDLNKLLSKKERKKNKQKRDLIEMVSKESCRELQKLKTNNLTMEQINNIVSGTSSQYIEKTLKVYEMSFEESVNQFLKDLADYLLFDCELIKKHAMGFKK